MNKKKISLDKYGISAKRYKELCGFCEQYPEWKRELANKTYAKAINYSDMPGSPNKGQSNPTQDLAMRYTDIENKIRIVENTAKEVDSELWQALIAWICCDRTLEYLQTIGNVCMSRAALYERRRYFFFLLDKARK